MAPDGRYTPSLSRENCGARFLNLKRRLLAGSARIGLRRQAVDLADLAAQVAHVRLRVDLARPERALHRLGRRELAAVAVEVVAQPLAERAELAALEVVVQGGEVGGDALPE